MQSSSPKWEIVSMIAKTIGIISGAISISFGVYRYWTESEIRANQMWATAWSLVAMNRGGGGGLNWALELLVKDGEYIKSLHLTTVDLSEAELTGAKLPYLQFERSNLYNATLVHADLSHASFYDSDLRGANFSGATLAETTFFHSNISNANFIGTGLTKEQIPEKFHGSCVDKDAAGNFRFPKADFTFTPGDLPESGPDVNGLRPCKQG